MQSANNAQGKAIFVLPKKYVMGFSGFKVNEYKETKALDDADLIIARGRLGIPGSGSLLIFIDNKGRILTCGTSPSHLIHGKTLEQAVYEEACEALEKIGFSKEG